MVCFSLLVVLSILWLNSQALNQKTAALERRLSQLSTPSCTVRDPWPANLTKQFPLTTAGGPRSFYVHLPANFDTSQYYPIVVFFPGKGASAGTGQAMSGLDSLPAITIYPEPTVGKDGALAWQGAPYSSGADDVQFVSDLLDKVEGQLCVQRTHVYAVGMSNGGGMVSLLSCHLSDRFAAYGIVAGALYYPDGGCKPSRPTPLINIHGDNDLVVPYFGSSIRNLPAIDNWVADRAHSNGCAPAPTTEYTNVTTTVTTWQNCQDKATVQNVRLRDAGHLWAIDAPMTLWQFLSQHSL
nr:Alpha/beta hydrolase family [uncultured bacterium]